MRFALVVSSICFAFSAAAQPLAPAPGPAFSTDRLPSVSISLHPDTLAWILDPANSQSDREWTATFAWQDGTSTQTVGDVGFRLRGRSSRTTPKRAFKVAFNAFTPGRSWNGLEKLNLNGVSYDPSVIRSVLASELARSASLPALRANLVRLTINGAYYGVYANAEHVDENFLAAHFRDGSGALYKCGWNATLEDLGDDPDAYRTFAPIGPRSYELQQGAGDFTDLAELVAVINRTPDANFAEALEEVFDVNGFLRTLAFDMLAGNWDNYAYNQTNYYLYRDPEIGRFRYIPYDFDLTFGLDLFGDAWDDTPLSTWTERPRSESPRRPLADRVLAVADYRDRLWFYIGELLGGPYQTEALHDRTDALRALIDDAVREGFTQTDPPYESLWTYSKFANSFVTSVELTSWAGLKPFIQTRAASARRQLDVGDVAPLISERRQSPGFAAPGDAVEVRVWVEDEETPASVTLTLEVDGERLASEDMTAEGDGVYVATVGPFEDGADVRYVIEASDAAGQTRQDPRGGWEAPAELATVSLDPTGLVVNELLASNDAAFADPAGEFDDWVELYNGASSPVSLAGLFFTDDLSAPDKFALPDTTIAAGAHILLWADDDDQGTLHMPFKLSADGEDAALFAADGAGGYALVDGVTFGEQSSDVSYGRSSDGAADFVLFDTPTPGSPNVLTSSVNGPGPNDELAILSVYPNPVRDRMTLRVSVASAATISANVVDLLGRTVGTVPSRTAGPGEHSLGWQGTLADGVYAIVVSAAMHDGTTIRQATRFTVLTR